MFTFRTGAIALTCVWLPVIGISQGDTPRRASDDVVAGVQRDPAVATALKSIEAGEPRVLEDQVRLCEVPAPPFKEAGRAEVFKRLLEGAGLTRARIDAVGNVIAVRPGLTARPNVVLSAHLDTVFPEGTNVRVTREGAVLKGAGIGDDCRGLAVLLGIARALDEARVVTPGTLTFVGTVGEEGLGDLRGVKHLLRESLRDGVDRFVSVDGAGDGITHVGVGSRRYRVTFRGPGGHSFGAFGLANPIHALGRAVGAIADVRVPSVPKTTFNVGRLGGGTSINTIAAEAWMEVDMRSSDDAALRAIEANVLEVIDDAVTSENGRWPGGRQVTVEKELVGDRPAGRTAESAPIVQAAMSVTRALGVPVQLDEGSTDANFPMSLGIPAITIDGGGRGSGAHSLGETFDSIRSWKGTQRAFLLAVVLTRS